MSLLTSLHLSMMKNAVKLPFQFDGDRMKQELESISDSFELIKNAYTGNTLFGMHLILPNRDGVANEKGQTYYMTEELKKCPYLQEVLNTFQSNVLTFRTQNLKAGGRIEKHNDGDKGLNSNVVRLNIPVSTNDEVYTYFNNERIPMKNGECWLPDVTKVHEMENRSSETRWHIMIDCDLNDWWKDILQEYGFDFESESQYKHFSLEELQVIKKNFLSMGMNESDEIVQELELELASRA